MHVGTVIRARGGLAATFELAAAGVTRHGIRAALAEGDIVRVRQGWYAERGRHEDFVRAARVGGRVTCVSALHRFGVWVHTDGRLHVGVRPDRTQLRSSRDHSQPLRLDRSRVRIHWSDTSAGAPFIVGAVEALAHYARCSTPEFFAATADSVLRARPELETAVRALRPHLPARHRPALDAADGVSESGTESLFRWRLRALLPVPLRQQVPFPNVGRVDFVLGARLVVEVDGAAYHRESGQFEKDRWRDATLSAQGVRVLRFSFRQVMHAWPTVERAVMAAIARGDAW